jgi:hypothetical protein
MKKQILILFALFTPFLALYSQDSYIKDRWNIKAGYAENDSFYPPQWSTKFIYADYRVEANYGFLEFLEAGVYLGFTWIGTIEQVWSKWDSKNVGTPLLGLNLNFHPLTFLIKKPDFRFDLYLLARYGGYYLVAPAEYLPARGFYFQYNHGAGLAFYLTKHIGVFGEYSYGVLAKPAGSLRCGMSVKF